MLKSVAKQSYTPSTEIVGRISSSDKISAAKSAMFSYETKIRELESEFEIKSSELRTEYLAELSKIHSESE
jgi:hypothetical protein